LKDFAGIFLFSPRMDGQVTKAILSAGKEMNVILDKLFSRRHIVKSAKSIVLWIYSTDSHHWWIWWQ